MLAKRLLTKYSIRGLGKHWNTASYGIEAGTSSYDGDGKTKATVMNNEVDGGLMINSFSQMGFRLNNGLMVIGPMVIFPKTVMAWNVNNYEEINEKSLSLICVLDPKIDVLVIGSGDQPMTPKFSATIIGFMKKYGINVEVLPTEQACTTFNFLNGEGRMACAAIIPPCLMSVSESDYVKYQLDRKRVLELE